MSGACPHCEHAQELEIRGDAECRWTRETCGACGEDFALRHGPAPMAVRWEEFMRRGGHPTVDDFPEDLPELRRACERKAIEADFTPPEIPKGHLPGLHACGTCRLVYNRPETLQACECGGMLFALDFSVHARLMRAVHKPLSADDIEEILEGRHDSSKSEPLRLPEEIPWPPA